MNQSRKLILVVGLQKSGTFLLRQLLVESGLVTNMFPGEGIRFWGDKPPFTPSAYPTGVLYQKYQEKMGHELGEADATDEIQQCLLERLEHVVSQTPILVNKNPYNTVRIPWLRSLFPDSVIVGIIRKPVPNVFSLLKRFTRREGYAYEPKNGWWGVKPKGWTDLIHSNKVVQCSQQWQVVNHKLMQDKYLLDLLVTYHDVCEKPLETVRTILGLAMGHIPELATHYPTIKCFDDEFKVGSRLLSKKRAADGSATLDTSWLTREEIELQSLTDSEIHLIQDICQSTAQLM